MTSPSVSPSVSPNMARSLVLSMSWVRELVPLAQAAEAAGFDRVWTTEYQGYDAMIRAALVAGSTDRIGIGTGITYGFTRAPLAMVAAVADVQSASNGRFTLGIGMGTNGMRTRWYDVEIDRPARRFGEYVRFIKAALDAEDGLVFEGEYHRADVAGFGLPDRDLMSRVEVWGSGVNAAMLRSAATHGDGVALHPLTMAPNYWESAIAPALDEAKRPDDSQAKLAMWVITSVADDEEAARLQARRNLAFYFSTPSYRNAAEGASWQAEATAVAGRIADGTPLDDVARSLPDAMVDELTLSGTPAQIRERIPAMEAALAERGISELVLQQAARGASREHTVESCRQMIRSAGPTIAGDHTYG